jgi:hypothetical protein
MILRQIYAFAGLAALMMVVSSRGVASAETVTGDFASTSPAGQLLEMTMTIDDTKTTFELTGPDYSWFAFGFDTMTMMGYSLIIEGTDGNRTAVEQNLLGIGSPGSPQTMQNISVTSTVHDDVNNLSTIVIERANNTGDANDPVFTTNMSTLDIIWAYDSFASPASPNPNLTYHGFGGKGTGEIAFEVVPEPTAIGLSMAAALSAFAVRRRFR